MDSEQALFRGLDVTNHTYLMFSLGGVDSEQALLRGLWSNEANSA